MDEGRAREAHPPPAPDGAAPRPLPPPPPLPPAPPQWRAPSRWLGAALVVLWTPALAAGVGLTLSIIGAAEGVALVLSWAPVTVGWRILRRRPFSRGRAMVGALVPGYLFAIAAWRYGLGRGDVFEVDRGFAWGSAFIAWLVLAAGASLLSIRHSAD